MAADEEPARKLILSRIWIWIINSDKWKIHCFLTDHTISVGRFRLNAHGRAVFSLCFQLSFPLIGMVKHLYMFAQTEKIFFKTSRYSVLAWIFSSFYFAKAGVSSIYYFHIPYSFLHLYPSRVYVTNLAASGVTSPLVGLKPIVGLVMTSLNILRQRLASAQVQVCDDDSLYWHRFNNPQSETGDSM